MTSRSAQSRGSRTIADGLEQLADALRSLTDEARHFDRTVSFGGDDEGFEGVVRVEFRTGIGDLSHSSSPSPATAREAADEASTERRVRRPEVEVEERADVFHVVAEMPGVTASLLEWAVEDRALSIAATTDRVRYERVVTLPGPVDADAATVSVEAGIVELTLPRPSDDEGVDE